MWLSAYYFVFCFGIITGDYHYLDDIRRGLDAVPGWSWVHRPLADYLFQFIEFGAKVPDIAPLPQIASLPLAALGSWLAVRLLGGQGKLAYGAALLIFGNCLYLENFSYQYDSLTMTLAAVLAIVAVAALREEHSGRRIAVSFILLTLAFLLYQPAWNAFLVLLFLLACRELQTNGMRPVRRLLVAGGVSIALAYSLASAICLLTSPHNAYESDHASTWPIRQMVPGIFHNFSIFGHMIASLVRDQSALPTGLALALASAGFIIVRPAWRQDKSIAQRVALCGLSGLFVALAILSSFGILLVLRQPVLAPRVLIGCGALLGGLWIMMENPARAHSALRAVLGAMLSLCLLEQVTIAFAYSAALRADKTYDEQIASRIVDDVYAAADTHPINLTIRGVPPEAPFAQPALDRWAIVGWLLPAPLSRTYWNQEVLRSAGLPATVNVTSGSLAPCHTPVVSRVDYDLCRTTEGLLLTFQG